MYINVCEKKDYLKQILVLFSNIVNSEILAAKNLNFDNVLTTSPVYVAP